MNAFWAVVRYTFIENIRNRTVYAIVVFDFIAVCSSMLFSTIAGEQELRIILDSGLSAMEIFALMLSVFLSIRLITSEIENKALYLIFSKPVRRHQYLLGRYAGILIVELSGVILMAVSILFLLLAKSWVPDILFLWQVLMISFKISMISAVAVFFSLVFTSPSTAIVSVFFIWLTGHAVSELRYLAERMSQHLAGIAVLAVSYAIPNFQIFNLKEYDIQRLLPGIIFNNVVYAVCYTAVTIALACFVFRQKEL